MKKQPKIIRNMWKGVLQCCPTIIVISGCPGSTAFSADRIVCPFVCVFVCVWTASHLQWKIGARMGTYHFLVAVFMLYTSNGNIRTKRLLYVMSIAFSEPSWLTIFFAAISLVSVCNINLSIRCVLSLDNLSIYYVCVPHLLFFIFASPSLPIDSPCRPKTPETTITCQYVDIFRPGDSIQLTNWWVQILLIYQIHL